ncbi:hypothetical protein KJ855_04730 [Patescibacteria group bacterium]|nr:hypothetical protein [Patescibacteria group bacterium]
MDLKESLKPIIRYWWVVVLTIIVAMLGIVVVDKMQPASYDGAVTLVVKQVLPASEEGVDYKYDGYYAVMANETFADTIESWLDSPDVVAEIYEKAELSVPQSMSHLSGVFGIEKVRSQSVSVRINAGSLQEAELLMGGMLEVIKNKVEHMLVDKDGQSIFTLTNSKILVLKHEVDYRLQFGIGLLGALCIGVFLTYFLFVMKED